MGSPPFFLFGLTTRSPKHDEFRFHPRCISRNFARRSVQFRMGGIGEPFNIETSGSLDVEIHSSVEY